jgi:glycosyltransferase involved in cell wall biosynthesis
VSRPPSDLRVLIVAENASARFGGEAILPLHYFRILRRRGIEAWLVVHARTRDELIALLPGEVDRMYFIPDTWFHRLAFKAGRLLPDGVAHVSFGYLLRLVSQIMARRLVRRLVIEHAVDVVHQPAPVSPKEPSMMFGLGAPVVIGSMNGGMVYPPAFAWMEGRFSALCTRLGRKASVVMNRLIPGKLRASALVVSNDRTERALPRGVRGAVIRLVENGVDLSQWSPSESPRAESESDSDSSRPTRFVFVGRLIEWKCVEVLLDAFREVVARMPATLEILGDGPLRRPLEEHAEALGVADAVRFAGWIPHKECADRLRAVDVLVLPSVNECGGAVVLEAMACGLPVIVTNWGGPPDYVDETCGILVEPSSREGLTAGFTEAMTRLAGSPELRAALGRAGRERVVREFDWERKVDRMIAIYEGVTMGRAHFVLLRADAETGRVEGALP